MEKEKGCKECVEPLDYKRRIWILWLSYCTNLEKGERNDVEWCEDKIKMNLETKRNPENKQQREFKRTLMRSKRCRIWIGEKGGWKNKRSSLENGVLEVKLSKTE